MNLLYKMELDKCLRFAFQVKGNIYCNGAGARKWWGGEKTDFTMAAGAMKCDGADLIIV